MAAILPVSAFFNLERQGRKMSFAQAENEMVMEVTAFRPGEASEASRPKDAKPDYKVSTRQISFNFQVLQDGLHPASSSSARNPLDRYIGKCDDVHREIARAYDGRNAVAKILSHGDWNRREFFMSQGH